MLQNDWRWAPTKRFPKSWLDHLGTMTPAVRQPLCPKRTQEVSMVWCSWGLLQETGFSECGFTKEEKVSIESCLLFLGTQSDTKPSAKSSMGFRDENNPGLNTRTIRRENSITCALNTEWTQPYLCGLASSSKASFHFHNCSSLALGINWADAICLLLHSTWCITARSTLNIVSTLAWTSRALDKPSYSLLKASGNTDCTNLGPAEIWLLTSSVLVSPISTEVGCITGSGLAQRKYCGC